MNTKGELVAFVRIDRQGRVCGAWHERSEMFDDEDGSTRIVMAKVIPLDG